MAAGFTLALVVWFYGFVPRFGSYDKHSLFGWLFSAWNGETGLEHGVCMPIMILGLIAYRFRDLRDAALCDRVSYFGLIAVFAGALLYAISQRFLMPRTSALGLPILLWGACHFLWGWKVAKIVFFPLIFFWLVIPTPIFNNTMDHFRLWVVSLTHHFSSLCEVETVTMGTTIIPVTGEWPILDFSMGCSNRIYALLPLLMVSAGWAYVAKIRMWQKVLLFLAAIPLAILGNVLRLTSILVIAENGDTRWATTAWYDWSGLLIVYPLSLFLLLVLHALFLGRWPWKKKSVFVAA
jgi:exosortase